MNKMEKKSFLIVMLLFLALSIGGRPAGNRFVSVQGKELKQPDGSSLFIKGANSSNWLNPEGYMFGFGDKTNSPRLINEMLCELVGPHTTAQFWDAYKRNFITEADIHFLASVGVNTLRLPFNYRLFTDEDYMGCTGEGDGFIWIDSLVSWARKDNIYVILDMHDAPGGQTGYNIDDSYGYPWLFCDKSEQDRFCSIWKKIAEHYKDDSQILGFELLNEPIADYWSEHKEMNKMLEPLYERCIDSIRSVDRSHIIILGAPQWNLNFKVFHDSIQDANVMFTCHRYDGEPGENLKDFISFRDSVNRPMYMGEIGHRTYEWQRKMCQLMIEAGIGYTFWPYKKIGGESFVSVKAPTGWQRIVDFSQADRSSYFSIYKSRPNQDSARQALTQFIINSRLKNCIVNNDYISSLLLK